MVELVVAMVGSVQLRETLWELRLPPDRETGAGGGAFDPSAPTVMLTEADVVLRPALSVAFAVMT
jgi:hypothetical protein